MAKIDPNGFAKWVKANIRKFATWFGADADKSDSEHAVRVAVGLGGSENAAVREAGVEFLLKAVPVESRAEFASRGGLDGIGWWLCTNDAKSAEAALGVLELFRGTGASFWAANVSPDLPAAIRERAAKLK